MLGLVRRIGMKLEYNNEGNGMRMERTSFRDECPYKRMFLFMVWVIVL